MVTARLIDGLASELAERPDAEAVIAAAPITDTIKEAGEDQLVERTVDRHRLWAAQTPQVFRTAKLRGLIGRDSEATDEAMLLEAAGARVLIHPVVTPNLKVTTPADLMIAEALLQT
jgi:2-C-methyl-D-erythritol 4-phosphate cytidylyltransferase